MRTVPLSAWVDELESGARPKGGIKDGNGEVPSIGAEHLADDGGFNFAKDKRIPYDFFCTMKKGHIQRNDILIVKDGATTGKTSFVNGDFPYEEAAINEHVFRLGVSRKKADPRFVFRYLQSPLGQQQIMSDFRGATVGGIGRTFLDKVFLPDVALNDQRRIASILDKADAIRRKREQSLALADDFVQSAYLYFVGLKHPEFQGWEPVPIESLAKDKRGSIRSGPFGSALLHSEFVDEGIAVLGIDNAVKNKFQWAERRFITREKYEELRRYRVYPKDVIITIMGTTGRSAVVPDDIPEAITTKHLASITCDLGEALPEFLSFAIHSDPVVIDQIRAANKGAIMDGLNLGIIRQIKLRKPPMRQQRLFADLLQKTHFAIQKMTTPSGGGSDLFASLSQRAFRGEL